MLGFSAISETAISEATTSNEALGFLAGNLLSTNINTVSFDAKANILSGSTSATFSLNILFDAKANTTLASVPATLEVNAFDSVFGEANLSLDNVTASFVTGQLTGTGLANFILPSNTLSIVVSDAVTTEAKANVTVPSATLSSFVNSFQSVTGTANIPLNTLLLTTATNLDAPNAVQFDFNKDDYDKSRVIHLLSQGSSSSNSTTVKVKTENRYTYAGSIPHNSNVVHIKPENRSVYIEYQRNNNTVYIAA